MLLKLLTVLFIFSQSAFAADETSVAQPKSTVAIGVFGGVFDQHVFSGNSGYDVSSNFSTVDFGVKASLNLTSFGATDFDFGVSVDRAAYRDSFDPTYNISTIGVFLQPFFRNVFVTGTNLGPEFGMRFSSNDGINPDSRHTMAFGVFAGYEYYFTPQWSVGPEVHFDYYLPAGNGITQIPSGSLRPDIYDHSTTYKILLTLNLHL